MRAYLEVEQIRLGSRLSVTIQVDDESLQASIPVLSIQPLVENAIKHGVAQRSEAGFVRIEAARQVGGLRITVENSGPTGSRPAAGAEVGLENLRRRLEICYGDTSRFESDFQPEIARVALWIPASGSHIHVAAG